MLGGMMVPPIVGMGAHMPGVPLIAWPPPALGGLGVGGGQGIGFAPAGLGGGMAPAAGGMPLAGAAAATPAQDRDAEVREVREMLQALQLQAADAVVKDKKKKKRNDSDSDKKKKRRRRTARAPAEAAAAAAPTAMRTDAATGQY